MPPGMNMLMMSYNESFDANVSIGIISKPRSKGYFTFDMKKA